jgi:hypothetical protein
MPNEALAFQQYLLIFFKQMWLVFLLKFKNTIMIRNIFATWFLYLLGR